MKNFIGIDVCEKSLDIFLHPAKVYKQFDNTKQGILSLCKYLKDFSVEQIAMEATGKLEANCAKKLIESGFNVSVVNPANVYHFRQSLGKKNKTDIVDAEVIARFCEFMRPTLSENLSKNQENLYDLSARRRQLIKSRTAEKLRLRRVRNSYCKQDLLSEIKNLDARIKKIDNKILEIVKSDLELSRRYKILISVTGVGQTTALFFICNFPELGKLNQKQVASLGGVIPLNQMSGVMSGKKSMRCNGRKKVRNSLYLATVCAIRHNNLLYYQYNRLIKCGKCKMVALGACMRKMLIIINTLIKEDRLWNENQSNTVN